MGRRVGRAFRRIGRIGEDLVRGTVGAVTGILGGLAGQTPEEDKVEPIQTLTQEKPVEEVTTPVGQLSQGDKKEEGDVGLGDVESIFNAVTGQGQDPFSRLMKKNQEEENKKKRQVM